LYVNMQLFSVSFHPSFPRSRTSGCVSSEIRVGISCRTAQPPHFQAEGRDGTKRCSLIPMRNYFDSPGLEPSRATGAEHLRTTRSLILSARYLCARPHRRIHAYTCTRCAGVGEVSPNAAAKLGIRQLLPG